MPTTRSDSEMEVLKADKKTAATKKTPAKKKVTARSATKGSTKQSASTKTSSDKKKTVVKKKAAKKEPEGEVLKRATKKDSSLASSRGTLVIVESPTKARSLTKMLGSGYSVKASVGHIIDLPKSRLAVDLDNDFEPEYILMRGKTAIKKELVAAAEKAATVLLASDPDREGEAIAWHLSTLLGIDPVSSCRIRMHEITKSAVAEAVTHPGPIDMNLVDAQQARRVLDRLVGYTLSPLLWKKIRRGLSAGRVQSVALSILCDRERAIEAFVPQNYWTVTALTSSLDGTRHYKLAVEKESGASLLVDGRTMKIDSQEKADAICDALRRHPFVVQNFVTRENRRKAPAPFKTSTLQQEAARRLGFSPKRTMSVAQSLFEGVTLPERGPVGLITYMRTDSLRLAPEAQKAMAQWIQSRYGKEYLPAKPNTHQSKSSAQDAHEAVRPTDVTLEPDALRDSLTADQFSLYRLIWQRAVASQMTPALVASSTLTVGCGDYGLKATGTSVLFQGWGRLWPLDLSDEGLEPAQKGETLNLDECSNEAKQTRPPSRYTEAQLIKELEDQGIGRPSTYASIVETLYDRFYVARNEDRRLEPTSLGCTVETFLVQHFAAGTSSPIMDTGFTAAMEDQLDQVESGKQKWRDVMSQFWKPFTETVAEAEKSPAVPPPPPEPVGEDCPQCGKALVKKRSRFGEFIGCSGYPDCTYIKPPVIGVACPKCGADQGGEVVKRKSKKGRTFFACTRWPDCDFISWNKPAGKKCSNCGADMEFKERARKAHCPKCGARDGDDESAGEQS